jgi:hypothetical protein
MAGLEGAWHLRDLWRQQDLPDVNGTLQTAVPAHGVVLLKLRAASQVILPKPDPSF